MAKQDEQCGILHFTALLGPSAFHALVTRLQLVGLSSSYFMSCLNILSRGADPQEDDTAELCGVYLQARVLRVPHAVGFGATPWQDPRTPAGMAEVLEPEAEDRIRRNKGLSLHLLAKRTCADLCHLGLYCSAPASCCNGGEIWMLRSLRQKLGWGEVDRE